MAAGKKPIDFEHKLADLEKLVEQLEDGDLSLEESLQAFERGVRLTRECQQALTAAEQRVQALVEESGEAVAVALPDGDTEEAADTDA